MPKVGLRYPAYCILGQDDVPGPGKALGRAKKADIKINTTDIEDYSDDAIGESLKYFSDGTITLENDDLEDEVASELLGEEKDESGAYISTGKDAAPFVQIGFIVSRFIHGAFKYRVIIYPKVKFAVPDDSFETEGKTPTFKSVTLPGTIYRGEDGKWRIRKEFSKLEEAVAWFRGQMKIDDAPAQPDPTTDGGESV